MCDGALGRRCVCGCTCYPSCLHCPALTLTPCPHPCPLPLPCPFPSPQPLQQAPLALTTTICHPHPPVLTTWHSVAGEGATALKPWTTTHSGRRVNRAPCTHQHTTPHHIIHTHHATMNIVQHSCKHRAPPVGATHHTDLRTHICRNHTLQTLTKHTQQAARLNAQALTNPHTCTRPGKHTHAGGYAGQPCMHGRPRLRAQPRASCHSCHNWPTSPPLGVLGASQHNDSH